MATTADLVEELKRLRKGRGVLVGRIDERVGSALRCVCQVTDEDGPAIIRRKVTATLQILASDLPIDLRLAVMAAFGIVPDARMPLYQDRVTWAAERLNRNPRTARRRIDDGILQIAELATASPVGPFGRPSEVRPLSGWETREVKLTVALDRPRPEVFEQRRIVASCDALAEIDEAVAVNTSPAELNAVVLYGGTFRRSNSLNARYELVLPRPLAGGESHEYVLRYCLPSEHLGRRHITFVPTRPCASFDLRVRFDLARVPRRIRLLAHAFTWDLEEGAARGQLLTADSAGEIHAGVRNLAAGLLYGVRWDY